MIVRLGWSGDIHGTWTKMDVEVDETDWNLHFAEAGADVSNLQCTPLEKFKLMYSLAEVFVQLHKMSRFPEYFAGEEAKKDLADLIRTRTELTNQILERAERPPF